MKLTLKGIVVFTVCLIFSGVVVATASLDYTVTYKNQQGSTLTLTWHPEKANTGTLSGMLTGLVASCKQSAMTPAAVSGVFAGNAIAMTVSYPRCDKVVAITGNLRNGNSELPLQWLSAMSGKDASVGAQIGLDTYIKIAS